MNPAELVNFLSAHPQAVVLDVRLADDFEAGRIRGAVHACVFQVDFLEIVSVLAPDKAIEIVVYGHDEFSTEAEFARKKLERAGYSQVVAYLPGLESWQALGYPVEGSGIELLDPIQRSLRDGIHALDLTESRVEWLGRNFLNKHWGTIALKSGSLVIADSCITGGEFVLNMLDIKCSDLAGDPAHDVLIQHLQSDDFFDVEQFPEAKFVITEAKEVNDWMPGAVNLIVGGDLTLCGQTHPVEMGVCSGISDDGVAAAQGWIAIDRTKWGIIYGSGKLFKRLAGHLVNDMIEIQLKLVCMK